jgi:uncharacterized protein (UPF0332 family)
VSATAAPLERGREELRGARALLDAGFPSQAVSRAYLAGYHAAAAALAAVGETPSTRAGVLSAFGRRVVGDGGVDHRVGRALRKLFEDRNDVDYALTEAPEAEARGAIAEAQVVIDAAARFISQR